MLNTQVGSQRLLRVSGAMGKFDDQGNLTDDGIKKQLAKYMAGFCEFVRRMQA